MRAAIKPDTKSSSRSTRADVVIASIIPDDQNRVIVEGEDFQALVDSVRVLGVLQALHVHDLGDGTFRLVDGERRWRAANEVGLESVPCEIWPTGASERETILAGVVLNDQRVAHGCLQVARRL